MDVVASMRQVCVLNADGSIDCHAGFTPDLPFEVTAIRGGASLWVCALGVDGERACWSQAGLVDLSAWPARVADVSTDRRPCVLDEAGTLRCASWDGTEFEAPEEPFNPVATLSEQVAELLYPARSHGPAFRRDDGVAYRYPDTTCELPGEDHGFGKPDCTIEPLPEGPYVKQQPPCLLTEDGRLTCDWDLEVPDGG